MNIRLAASLFALVLAATVVWATEGEVTEEENMILTLVLKRSSTDRGYTVVSPETWCSGADSRDSKGINQTKQYIAEHLQTNGVAVTKLVDQLFERNKKKVRLPIKSSPKDGYMIDFDGKYAKYFKKDGGGWEKWHKENPNAYGSTTVSLPVYDHQAGLVLVYTGTQTHWLEGSTWVILYKYEKGKLRQLAQVMMSVS